MNKKIFTSNYARNGHNPNAIAISLIVPEWFNGPVLSQLAPETDMLKNIKANNDSYNQRKYRMDYINLLKRRGVTPHELIESIPDGSILLCYEKPGDFCHRRILAEWIEYNTGFVIEEMLTEKEYKKKKIIDNLLDFDL